MKGGCAFCESYLASISYSLLFCSIISKIWKITILTKFEEMSSGDLFGLCIHLKDDLSRYDFELFAMLVGTIWKEIFRLLHYQSINRNPIKVDWIIPYFEEF